VRATADVTELLGRWNDGDSDTLAELIPVVYTELHKLASHDHARRKRAAKRENERRHVDLEQIADTGIDLRIDLIALDSALERLAEVAPQPARVVELRSFRGLSFDESGAFLNVAPVTVKRHWSFAREWLYRAHSRRNR
jgi:DNA-directed RNA polymerase specialized sigma24 family protein